MVRKRNKRRYHIPETDLDRRKISKDLIKVIKKVQTQLQLLENMRYGSKAQKVTFYYASKEVIKKLK